MILAKVTLLELTREPNIETGSMVDALPHPQRKPKNSKTIPEPPPHKRKDADGLKFEKVLAAYPSDRLRDKQACLTQIEDSLNG